MADDATTQLQQLARVKMLDRMVEIALNHEGIDHYEVRKLVHQLCEEYGIVPDGIPGMAELDDRCDAPAYSPPPPDPATCPHRFIQAVRREGVPQIKDTRIVAAVAGGEAYETTFKIPVTARIVCVECGKTIGPSLA